MNKTKGAFDSPELWSPGCTQSSTSLTSLAPPFAFGQQAMDTALNIILIVVLLVITVSLGCTIEIAKITTHLRRPKGVAVAMLVQYSIMPLTAFLLGKLFQLGTSESLTILICGCCPGGNLSNIFSLALRGDMNLSVVMTACSMVLAIGLMPLLLYLYSGGLYEDDLEGKVPYKGIITSLVLMLIPCAIGIILNEKKPQYTGLITKAGMVMLLLSSAAVIVLSVANMGRCIMVVFSPPLLGTSALMPLTGFLLGYAVSAAFKLDDRCRRTVCMETGCQNVQLCSAILKVTFTPEIIGPLYFFPLLYLLFQLGEGFLLILVFRIHDRKKQANVQQKLSLQVWTHLALKKCNQCQDIAGTVENQENNTWILQQLLSQLSKPSKLYLLQPAHRSPAVLSSLSIHSLQQPQSHLHPHLLSQRSRSRLSLALSAQKGGDLQ